MNTQFYIVLSLKTAKEPESYARFFIGKQRDKAYEIFRKLKGTKEVNDKNILYLEFVETQNSLPLNLDMITCNLDQLAENCKMITKELFKLANLETSDEL